MTSLASAKAKGRVGEQAVCDYLRNNGFPLAERRRLEGVLDRGDVAGVKGTAIEVKACQTPDVQAWWREAQRERVNAGATRACVWWRPPRRVDPARHVVIVDFFEQDELCKAQGGAEYVVFPWQREPVAVLGDRADEDRAAHDNEEWVTSWCAWWPVGARRITETAFYVTSGRQYVALLRRICGELP